MLTIKMNIKRTSRSLATVFFGMLPLAGTLTQANKGYLLVGIDDGCPIAQYRLYNHNHHKTKRIFNKGAHKPLQEPYLSSAVVCVKQAQNSARFVPSDDCTHCMPATRSHNAMSQIACFEMIYDISTIINHTVAKSVCHHPDDTKQQDQHQLPVLNACGYPEGTESPPCTYP